MQKLSKNLGIMWKTYLSTKDSGYVDWKEKNLFVGFGNETIQQIFKHPMSLKNGFINVEEKSGLGVDYDEVVAESYQYKRSYLPVTRLEDGTLWNW